MHTFFFLKQYKIKIPKFFCSAWLRLKLNTKISLNHPTTTPHHPTTRNYLKGSKRSRRLTFGMLASLKLRDIIHYSTPMSNSNPLTLSLGDRGNENLASSQKPFQAEHFRLESCYDIKPCKCCICKPCHILLWIRLSIILYKIWV